MDQWPLLKPHASPGWTEFVYQHCGASVQLCTKADRCWLGSKERHTRTVELRCGVSFCKSGGNGCFSIFVNGLSSMFMGEQLSL